jgi:hypothetical protein
MKVEIPTITISYEDGLKMKKFQSQYDVLLKFQMPIP